MIGYSGLLNNTSIRRLLPDNPAPRENSGDGAEWEEEGNLSFERAGGVGLCPFT